MVHLWFFVLPFTINQYYNYASYNKILKIFLFVCLFVCYSWKNQLNRMANNKPSKVILWSTPRSLSTSLKKCLSFYSNSVIWFEPYVAAMYYGPNSRWTPSSSPSLWKGEPGKDLETSAKCIQIPEGLKGKL